MEDEPCDPGDYGDPGGSEDQGRYGDAGMLSSAEFGCPEKKLIPRGAANHLKVLSSEDEAPSSINYADPGLAGHQGMSLVNEGTYQHETNSDHNDTSDLEEVDQESIDILKAFSRCLPHYLDQDADESCAISLHFLQSLDELAKSGGDDFIWLKVADKLDLVCPSGEPYHSDDDIDHLSIQERDEEPPGRIVTGGVAEAEEFAERWEDVNANGQEDEGVLFEVLVYHVLITNNTNLALQR